MTGTAEELAASHPRRELEEMAEKLGIGTIGIGNKVSLAEAIIKAKEEASAKEMPKPKVEVKAQVKPAFGKKGVLAKRADMDNKAKVMQKGVEEIQKSFNAQIKENEKAAAKIGIGVKALKKSIEEKTDVLQKGVEEIQKTFNAQIKENEKAVARIESGVTELQNETRNYIQDFYYG